MCPYCLSVSIELYFLSPSPSSANKLIPVVIYDAFIWLIFLDIHMTKSVYWTIRTIMIGMATLAAPGVLHSIRGMAITIPTTGSMRMANRVQRFFLMTSAKLEGALIFYYALSYK